MENIENIFADAEEIPSFVIADEDPFSIPSE